MSTRQRTSSGSSEMISRSTMPIRTTNSWMISLTLQHRQLINLYSSTQLQGNIFMLSSKKLRKKASNSPSMYLTLFQWTSSIQTAFGLATTLADLTSRNTSEISQASLSPVTLFTRSNGLRNRAYKAFPIFKLCLSQHLRLLGS